MPFLSQDFVSGKLSVLQGMKANFALLLQSCYWKSSLKCAVREEAAIFSSLRANRFNM